MAIKGSTTANEQCVQMVWRSEGSWGRHSRCTRKAVIGQYCKQHDPVAVKARSEAQSKAWKDKWDVIRTQDKIDADNKLVGAWIRENAGSLTSCPLAFEDYCSLANADRIRDKEINAHKS